MATVILSLSDLARQEDEWKNNHSADRDLINKTLAGDRSAFRELVQRYQERAYRVAYNFVRDFEEARDISQEAFIKTYKSLDKFDHSKNFYTWFYRILVNLCVDNIRKNRKKNVSIEEMGDMAGIKPGPVTNLETSEVRGQIDAVLDSLPEKYKTLIILRDIEGLSCLDIAKILRCSYTTVRWRLHKARTMFRDNWEKLEKKNKKP